MSVLDYSAARPGAGTVRASGASGVVRYVGAITASFNLTRPEVDELTAAGLGIGIVIERRPDDILLGRAKGAEMAALALKETRALGLPDGLVWAPVDSDATLGGPTTPGSPGDRQMQQVALTLQGFADVLGWANVGVYGGWYVIQWLIDHQVPVAAFWQASAPSWSWTMDTHFFQVHPRAVLRQYVTHPGTPAGCDYNDILGDWRPRVAKVVPTGMNTTEIQQHLVAIGFPIAVDGGYGSNTTRAVEYFQQGYGRAGTRLMVDGLAGPVTQAALQRCVDEGGHLSEHFTFVEFACSHCHWPRVHWALPTALEQYRAKLSPGGVRIVSGYRCPIHNASIPGAAPNSQHLYGTAADVDPVATTAQVVALRVFSGVEVRSGGKVYHVDVRHAKPETNWTGSSVANPSVFRFGLMASVRNLVRRK